MADESEHRTGARDEDRQRCTPKAGRERARSAAAPAPAATRPTSPSIGR